MDRPGQRAAPYRRGRRTEHCHARKHEHENREKAGEGPAAALPQGWGRRRRAHPDPQAGLTAARLLPRQDRSLRCFFPKLLPCGSLRLLPLFFWFWLPLLSYRAAQTLRMWPCVLLLTSSSPCTCTVFSCGEIPHLYFSDGKYRSPGAAEQLALHPLLVLPGASQWPVTQPSCVSPGSGCGPPTQGVTYSLRPAWTLLSWILFP